MKEECKRVPQGILWELREAGIGFRIVLAKGGGIQRVSNRFVIVRRRLFLFDIDVVVRCSVFKREYSEVVS